MNKIVFNFLITTIDNRNYCAILYIIGKCVNGNACKDTIMLWRNSSPKMHSLTNFPQKMAKYLLIILLLGLLLQSSLYLYLNIFLPYSNVAENITLANQRIQIRTLAESLCSACILLYTLGHIYLVYFYHKKKLPISLKEIFSRFVLHILVSVLCVVPFALLDSFFSGTSIFIGDYIFPLKRMAVIWPVLFLIFVFAH